jgi:ribonuclease HII
MLFSVGIARISAPLARPAVRVVALGAQGSLDLPGSYVCMSTHQHGGRRLTRRQIRFRAPPFQHPIGSVHGPLPPSNDNPFPLKGKNKKKKVKPVVYEDGACHELLADLDARPVDGNTQPSRLAEETLAEHGFKTVCGVDDSGRTAIAGPIIAAACHVPLDVEIPNLLLAKTQKRKLMRREAFAALTNHPQVKFSVARVEAREVDETGVDAAAKKAQRLAIEGLDMAPDFCLIDGIGLPESDKCKAPMNANANASQTTASAAAAYIIAKTTREQLMKDEFQEEYPKYYFRVHLVSYCLPRESAFIHSFIMS